MQEHAMHDMGAQAQYAPGARVVKVAAAVRSALHSSGDIASITGNTPAKPMWTSVLTLKSSGFFIACRSPHVPVIDGGAAS